MSIRSLAWLTSFLVGFVSLGQEVLWVRIAAFANGNSPQTFAMVLSLFLAGIVLGSLAGKRLCERADTQDELRRNGAWALVVSATVDWVSPFVLIQLGAESIWLSPVMGVLILSTAASKAVLFPVVHHLGSKINTTDTGRSIARVYFLNILGATASPIIIGFWGLDHWSSQTLMEFLGASSLLVAAVFYPGRKVALATVGVVAGLLTYLIWFQEETTLLRALAQKGADQEIAYLRENRQGVVHTLKDLAQGDVVFGGNVYDGKVNTDLVRNSNGIDRVYLLTALHAAAPRRILVIGLSAGPWTRVLAEFEGVERIDAVEINPGYLDLIRSKPEVNAILADDRIHIHIDDGRRWLRRYQGEPFDLIVMNTSFHWRAYSTNLLSREFMQLVRSHLAPEGVMTFNGTSSPDTLATAASVFGHAYRWHGANFVYAAEHDFRHPDGDSARMRLLELGRKFAPQTVRAQQALASAVSAILARGWVDVAQETRLAGRPLEVITDQNLLTEYRYGQSMWW